MINSTSPRFQSPLLRSATIYDFGRWTRTPWYTGYALRGTSPCVNRGHPDADYNDQNGTRNDMGAFGGPNGFDFRPGW